MMRHLLVSDLAALQPYSTSSGLSERGYRFTSVVAHGALYRRGRTTKPYTDQMLFLGNVCFSVDAECFGIEPSFAHHSSEGLYLDSTTRMLRSQHVSR